MDNGQLSPTAPKFVERISRRHVQYKFVVNIITLLSLSTLYSIASRGVCHQTSHVHRRQRMKTTWMVKTPPLTVKRAVLRQIRDFSSRGRHDINHQLRWLDNNTKRSCNVWSRTIWQKISSSGRSRTWNAPESASVAPSTERSTAVPKDPWRRKAMSFRCRTTATSVGGGTEDHHHRRMQISASGQCHSRQHRSPSRPREYQIPWQRR